jgi:signal transduction histidine kinase
MKSLAILFCVFLSFQTKSQTAINLDSLLRLLPLVNQDSSAVILYLNIGEQYETNNPEIAKQYYRKAGKLSSRINYVEGFCKYAFNYSAVLNMQGKIDSSLLINQESLVASQSVNNEMLIAKSMFNIANCYNYKEQFETALDYYLKITPYFEKLNNKSYLSLLYDVMQLIFQNMEQYDQAIFYGEKALALSADQPESNQRGTILMNLSINYAKTNPPQTKRAIDGYIESLRIAKLNENLYLESSVLVNLADHFYQIMDYEKAKKYYTEVLPIQIQIDDQNGICMSKRGLSYYELYNKRFDSAEVLLMQALAIAKENHFLTEEKECFSSLAEVYLARNDYRRYHQYVQQSDSLNGIILDEKILRATKELELKYESNKKQSQIDILEKDKKLQKINFLGMLGASIFIIILGFFYFRNQKRKHLLIEKDSELKAQRISELEKEKQLTASQALLEGESEERKRLARDLHDGLGGMLSVVKLNLIHMQGNAIMPESDIPAFRNALDMLDGSIRELRRVAHNLMPESLMRYGLRAALSDFCRTIDHVTLHFFGDDGRIEEKFEVAIFRIAQELVNNAIKHSGANQINVQLIQEKNRVNLVVQDNGSGFDATVLQPDKTTGIRNIRSRVESLGGQLELSSFQDKGTEVQVNFNF